MREPSWEQDGWELDDGEERHRKAPETFWIPPRDVRAGLTPGDYAKLIFRISVDNEEAPVAVERMWVIVSGRTDGGYIGILDNEPDAIAENEDFWPGTELPFEPRHVIDVEEPSANSVAIAASPPRKAWLRD